MSRSGPRGKKGAIRASRSAVPGGSSSRRAGGGAGLHLFQITSILEAADRGFTASFAFLHHGESSFSPRNRRHRTDNNHRAFLVLLGELRALACMTTPKPDLILKWALAYMILVRAHWGICVSKLQLLFAVSSPSSSSLILRRPAPVLRRNVLLSPRRCARRHLLSRPRHGGHTYFHRRLRSRRPQTTCTSAAGAMLPQTYIDTSALYSPADNHRRLCGTQRVLPSSP